MKIAQVYINQLHSKVDSPYDYFIPDEISSIQIGMRVMVPFGNYNRLIDGVVVNVKEDSEFSNLKKITGIVDHFPQLSQKQIQMCFWLTQQYHCLFMEAVNCYIPSNLNIKKVKTKDGIFFTMTNYSVKTKYYSLTDKFKDKESIIDELPGNAVKQRSIIQELTHSPTAYDELKDRIDCKPSQLKSLVEKGFISESYSRYIRNPYADKAFENPRVALNNQQKKILDTFNNTKNPNIFLIHGVTGSGKTEIYLNMMEETIKKGGSCLYLVPEISLTSQVVGRIMGRFKENIGIIHSKLSVGEKIDQWYSIKNGDYKIVIGARSAIFAPFQDIGLIILDEEHENTYKSSNRPRYYTHDVAKKLAQLYGCHIVLGSATPSVVSYYNAKRGDYKLMELTERATSQSLPEVEIIDMKEELYNGNRSELSNSLDKAIRNNIKKKEQIILFLNKRGYASYIFCRSCGYVVKCPKCDVTMTLHKEQRGLLCHYCGYYLKKAPTCPRCGSSKFKQMGTGTEKLEMQLQDKYKGIRTLRMDADSMQRKGSYDEVIEQFSSGKADILLGTQMVTKGFDFSNVTLVGVILADAILNIPDYKSSERTFQLLTQVAGRAGRGDKPGRVIIQTYHPDHYSIQMAKLHDYKNFYNKEIKYREMMNYPPYCHIIYFGFINEYEDMAKKECETYHKRLSEYFESNGLNQLKDDMYKPTFSPIKKINNKYRWYFIIKTNNLPTLNKIIWEIKNEKEISQMKSTKIIDINPNNII